MGVGVARGEVPQRWGRPAVVAQALGVARFRFPSTLARSRGSSTAPLLRSE